MEEEVTQAKEGEKEVVSPQAKKEKGSADHFFAAVREIVAISFWVYVVTKLFVFDIDILLVEHFSPNYIWLLNYKFFILIGILAAIWLVTKNKQMLSWSLYTLFYPAIIFLWKVPFFVFKQRSWIFAFAVINALISFFQSIKYNFIVAALFLVSLSVIFIFSNPQLLWPAILLQFAVLLIIYSHRFILVFKPSSIYMVHIKILSGLGRHTTTSYALEEDIRHLPVERLDQKQLEKWTANLQTSVLFNRICLFTVRRLKDYQNISLNVLSYVLTILLLTALTILSFSAINFGLYKINNSFFQFPASPTFFTFFHYGFNNLLFNSTREITPITAISQTVSMLESIFALVLLVIFVSLLFSVRSRRYSEELSGVIKSIQEQAIEIEAFIKDEYKINNIEDAMAELQKLKAGLAKFLYKITASIK